MMETVPAGLHKATAYANLTFIGLGLVGCLCMVRLATVSSLQRYSCSIFLLTLGLSDTVLLVFEGLEDVAYLLPNVTRSDLLFGASEWRCRFSVFSQETARLLSSWMVVALAAELYLITCHQSRRASVASPKRAFQLNLSVLLITFASCFPFLVITTSTADNSCSSKYSLFFDIYAKVIMKSITNTFTPILFILWCVVLVVVHKSRHATNKTTHNSDNMIHKSHEDARASPAFVCVVVLVFALLLLPYGVTDLLHTLLRLKERYWPDMNLVFTQSAGLTSAHGVSRVFMVLAYSSKFYMAFWLDKGFRKALKKECFSFGHLQQPSRHDEEPERKHTEPNSVNTDGYVFINHGLSISNNDINKDGNVVEIGDYSLYNIMITQF